MSDDKADFVPIEPTPAVAQPVAPPPSVAQPAAQPVTAPPAGYYAPPPPPPYAGGQPGVYPAPGQPGAYPAQYAFPPAPPQGLSVASMILGIIGTFFSLFYGIGLFPAIAAVITGHLARKRQPHAKGFWLTGLITGYVGIGIALLWIAGLIVIFAVLIPASGGYSNSSDF